jgi:hypothetical protein
MYGVPMKVSDRVPKVVAQGRHADFAERGFLSKAGKPQVASAIASMLGE